MTAARKRVESPWLTVDEAAAYLRCTRFALIKRIERGQIAPDVWGSRGRGQRHLFNVESLDKYLKNGGR